MGITLDEFLIKLGVDADEAKKASDEVEKLTDKVKKVPEHAEPAFEKFAKDLRKHVNDAVKDAIKSIGELTAHVAKEAIEAPFKAFEAIEKHTAKIDKAAKQARSAGLELEEFGKLAFLGDLSGIGANTVVSSVNRLNKALIDVSFQGAKPAKDALSLLGLTAKDLLPLDSLERVKLLADRFNLVEDKTLKSSIALKLFGKSGGQLLNIFDDGSAGIAKNLDGLTFTSNATGEVAEKLDDSITILRKQTSGFKGTILSEAIPATLKITEAMNDWLKVNSGWIKQDIATVTRAVAEGVEGLVPAVKEVATEVGQWVRANELMLKQQIPEWGKGMISTLKSIGGAVGSTVQAFHDLGTGIEALTRSSSYTSLSGFAKNVIEIQTRAGRKAIDETDDRALKRQSRENAALIGLPREYSHADVSRAETELKELKAQKEANIRRASELARRKLELGKPKKTKKEVKGKTFEEISEALLFGETPTDEIKKLSTTTASTKDVKPTVAIDFFHFQITQSIYTVDAKKAGDESASSIKREFQSAKARINPVGNIAR